MTPYGMIGLYTGLASLLIRDGTDDDALFVCPLNEEMVQFGNLFWEAQRARNRGQ